MHHELDPVALMHQTIGLRLPSTFGRSSNQNVPTTTRQSEKASYQIADLLHRNLEEAKDEGEVGYIGVCEGVEVKKLKFTFKVTS